MPRSVLVSAYSRMGCLISRPDIFSRGSQRCENGNRCCSESIGSECGGMSVSVEEEVKTKD
jgi:hypothetical protein